MFGEQLLPGSKFKINIQSDQWVSNVIFDERFGQMRWKFSKIYARISFANKISPMLFLHDHLKKNIYLR